MTLQAAIGHAQALDGREAGLQAAHQALNHLGVGSPGLGILISSNEYQPREVLTGVASLLGDAPLIGFSTPAGLTNAGQQSHSVTLALLSGDFKAESHWFSGYAQSGRETANSLVHLISGNKANQAVIFFADGFNGDAEQLCSALQESQVPIVGGLSSGDAHTGNTYQMAGNQTRNGQPGRRDPARKYPRWDRVCSRLGPGGQSIQGYSFARLLASNAGRASGFGDICRTFWSSGSRLGFSSLELSGAAISARR